MGKNSAATFGLVFGIICLIVNPFLLQSIFAMVCSGIALTRANQWENRGHSPIGRTKAIWGMCLGGVGLLASMILKGFVF
jgi:hypothetical protein